MKRIWKKKKEKILFAGRFLTLVIVVVNVVAYDHIVDEFGDCPVIETPFVYYLHHKTFAPINCSDNMYYVAWWLCSW